MPASERLLKFALVCGVLCVAALVGQAGSLAATHLGAWGLLLDVVVLVMVVYGCFQIIRRIKRMKLKGPSG